MTFNSVQLTKAGVKTQFICVTIHICCGTFIHQGCLYWNWSTHSSHVSRTDVRDSNSTTCKWTEQWIYSWSCVWWIAILEAPTLVHSRDSKNWVIYVQIWHTTSSQVNNMNSYYLFIRWYVHFINYLTLPMSTWLPTILYQCPCSVSVIHCWKTEVQLCNIYLVQ